MSMILDDPRCQESDELSFEAEHAWNACNREHAKVLFSKAAALETAVANEVSGPASRLRSVLAVSAVALWRKAYEFEKAMQVAYGFLAKPEQLTTQGKTDLLGLIGRCMSELSLSELGIKPESIVSVEMRLEDGDVGYGVAPVEAVRHRQVILPNILGRTLDFRLDRPFRQKIDASRVLFDSYRTYDAPALPGSYGLRLYLAPLSQIDSSETVLPAELLSSFLEILMAIEDESRFSEVVEDPQYRIALTSGLRELAPDGAAVGRVTIESPLWYISQKSITLDSSYREILSRRLLTSKDTQKTPAEAIGVLKIVDLKAKTPSIVVVESEEKSTKFYLDRGRFDDTIGPKVNRRVRVVGEVRKKRASEPALYALDVQLLDSRRGNDRGQLPLIPISEAEHSKLLWIKQMRSSDAQRPSKGSPIGSLRLGKSQQDIDHTRWFREQWFPGPWETIQKRGKPHEYTWVLFDVLFEGQESAEHRLLVDHAMHRESAQGNMPTWIHLDDGLKKKFKEFDYTGWWLILEKTLENKFRIEIRRQKPHD